MLVIPARATGSGGNHAPWFIVDPFDLVLFAVFPWRGSEMFGPGMSVALAFNADQNCRRGVRMGFGVAPILVLTDPKVKRVVVMKGSTRR